MKTLSTLLAVLTVAGSLRAEIKIPKDVLRMAQYEEAMKQGVEQKKPLALVIFDEVGKESPANTLAVEEVFKAVKSWAVVVFVSCNDNRMEHRDLSPPFRGALQEDTTLLYPLLIIASPREDVVWKLVGIATQKTTAKDLKKLYKDAADGAKPAVATYFSAKTTPPLEPPGDKVLEWTRQKEGAYMGPFVKLEGEMLIIKTPQGKNGKGIPLSELRPGAVRYAKALAALTAAPAAPVEKPAAPAGAKPGVPEKWTNQQGKEIVATFVSLKDDKVTLRLANGKESTLPLNSLSLASQIQAKELAGPAKP